MAINLVNEISIRSKLLSAGKKRQFAGIARTNAKTRLVFATQGLLRDFDNHIVTQELNPDNVSEEGSELIDHGNLFSFIGFPAGSHPAQDLRNYLQENIEMSDESRITDNGRNIIYYSFKVSTPSMTQINNEEQFATPDNWRSTSWIDIIENGVSNAVYYIFAGGEDNAKKFEEAGSRSGWGLQRKDKAGRSQQRSEGGTFTPKKYISELLESFRRRFQ